MYDNNVSRFKINHKLLLTIKLVLTCITIIGLALLAGFIDNTISNDHTALQLNRSYNKVGMPSNLHLTSKEYFGSSFWQFLYGPDVSGTPIYTYSYTPITSQTMQTIHDDISTYLSSRGYYVVKPKGITPSDSVNWLSASNSHICLNIMLNPEGSGLLLQTNSTNPVAIVSDTNVQVSEPPC